MRPIISEQGSARRPLAGALLVAGALTCLMLAGCDDSGQPMVNSKICADFRATPASAPAVDAAGPVDECVRRWAYSLAGARDGADIVASAAVAACGAALTRWNQASLDQPTSDSTGAAAEPYSIDTGQPTNALAEHDAFAHRQALLYVVEARAGHCRPPPVVKGVPAGA